MAYNYHGTNGLIALPGRSIATFPSGLVRVDRTYACRTERAGAFRQQFAVGTILPFDDGTPAIDGLYIFPDAQETQKEDGFTEFKVSAYGRTNTEGYTRREFLQGSATISNSSTNGTFVEDTQTVLNEQIVQTFVTLSESPFLFQFGIPDNSLKVYFPDGEEIFEKYPNSFEVFSFGGFQRVTTTVKANFDGTSSTNFGRWTEVVIQFKAAGFVQIFVATPSA